MAIRKLFTVAVIVAAVGATIVACGDDSNDTLDVASGTVIKNVSVVNTRDGSIASQMSVVLNGGKIQTVTAQPVRAGSAVQVIDATGKYVVPGFLDMHTHSMVRADSSPTYFPLMIAYGITGFREMGAFVGQLPTMVVRARKLNADSAAGLVDAPEALLVPSDIFVGASTAASGVQGVAQQKALGVDFIKIISANREGMLSFLSESKRAGLDLAGHLTPAVSAAESSQLGWKTMEHLGGGLGILLDCADDETAIRDGAIAAAGTAAPSFPSDLASVRRTISTYNNAKCVALAKTFVSNGTWHVPTLRRVRAIQTSDDPVFLNDPNLVYVDKGRIAQWQATAAAAAARPAAERAALAEMYTLQKSVTKLLKQNGVKMMTGSDAGQASTWVIPGFGLHQDFQELGLAGLSPLEILQMATLNGAEFLHRESSMGTVDAGKNADLVLLDANPIADVANLSKISAVFLKGRHFPKNALDKMKSDTADAYRLQVLSASAAFAEPDHGH